MTSDQAAEEAELEKTGLEKGLEVLDYQTRMRRVPAKRNIIPSSASSLVGVGAKPDVMRSRTISPVAIGGGLSGSKFATGHAA